MTASRLLLKAHGPKWALCILAALSISVVAFGNAELRITKTVCDSPPCPGSATLTVDEGDTVTYCFKVENIGDAAALNVFAVDNNGTSGSAADDITVSLTGLTDEDGDLSNDDLAPGASASGSFAKILNSPGTVTNIGYALGVDATSGEDIQDSDSVTVTVNDLVAQLRMTKTVCDSPPCPGSATLTVDEGDTVIYCFKVENIGEAAALNVLAVDNNGTPGSATDDITVSLTGLTDEDGDSSNDDLAPGASASGSFAKILNSPGTVTNIGYALGVDATSGEDIQDSDSVTVTVNDLVAQLRMTKTVCTSPPCPGSATLTVDEGDTVTYCYKVENIGDAAALNVLVVDNNGTPGSTADDFTVSLTGLTDEDGDTTPDDLAPGASASGSVAKILSSVGTVTNIGYALGVDATSGEDIQDSDSVTVTVNDLVAQLQVTKTVTTESGSCPGSDSLTVDEGDTVRYCYTVRNTGGAAALNVLLVDDNGTPSTGDDFTVSLTGLTNEDGDSTNDDLAPGASASGTALVTLSTPGSVTNTATGFASDATSGGNVQDSDSVTVTVNDLVAELEVTKTASPTTIDEGGTVTYSYTVTNTGTAAALRVVVVDDNGTPGATGDDFEIPLTGLTDENDDTIPEDLAPGATASGTAEITLSTPGSVTNTAWAYCYDVTSGLPVSDSDGATVTVNDLVAELDVTKTASPTTIDEGGSVTYSYTVTNTGTAVALRVVVVDDNGTPGATGDDFEIPLTGLTDENDDAIPEDLAPGATASGTAEITLSTPGSVTNTAWAYCYDVTSGLPVSDSDDATVTVNDLVAGLELTKTVTTESGSCPGSDSLTVDEGDTVRYCYTVRNTGGAAALNVLLVDDNGTPSTGDDFTVSLTGLTNEDGDSTNDDLAPGASASGTALVTLSTPGSVTNTATGFASDATSGGDVQDSDSVTVTVNDLVAQLQVTKTVTTESGSCPGSGSLTVDEGDTVRYCYRLQNVGSAPALDIQAVDDYGTPANPADDCALTFSGLTDQDGDSSADDLAAGSTATAFLLVTLFDPGTTTNRVAVQGFDSTSGDPTEDVDSVTVTVRNLPPVFHDCPGDITVPNDPGAATAVVTWTPPTATDASGEPPTVTSTHAPGDTFPAGRTLVTYTAEDEDGGESTCTFAVVVENTEPPVITIRSPEDKGCYMVGEEVMAQWTATSLVGLAAVHATAPDGGLIDTSEPGCFSFQVTATDTTGLTTSQSVEWCALLLIGPSGTPSGWPEGWLCIDHPIPYDERPLVGVVPLGGVYAVGEPVLVFFTLKDANGLPVTDCIASITVTKVVDPESAAGLNDLLDYFLAYQIFAYDPNQGGYAFDLQTWGYPLGYYDLWITVYDHLYQRIRIEIVAPPPEPGG